MTAEVLNIPDDAAELPTWLEQQLISGNLAALVAQLEAVHRRFERSDEQNRGNSSTLDEILGPSREAVLTHGIPALENEQIGRLLVQPELLMDLQEQAFVHGADYWRQRASEIAESQQNAEEQRRRLWRYLTADDQMSTPSKPQRAYLMRRDLLIALASAAAVLIGVFGYQRLAPRALEPQSPQLKQAWGWSNPSALPESGTKQAYLAALADAAHEWFNQRPTSAGELAVRIGQLRQGCSTLILAQHKPLSDADRAWLKERCQSWAKKFGEQLAAVESGANPATIRAETDATINKLIGALHARAEEAPAST